VSNPNFIKNQQDCEEAAQRIGGTMFSIDVDSSGITKDPAELSRSLRVTAIELGSK
jgi:hypothetical protein